MKSYETLREFLAHTDEIPQRGAFFLKKLELGTGSDGRDKNVTLMLSDTNDPEVRVAFAIQTAEGSWQLINKLMELSEEAFGSKFRRLLLKDIALGIEQAGGAS